MGSAATSRPPVQLPRDIREIASAPPQEYGIGNNNGRISNSNGNRCNFDDFSLEHAVLKRKAERDEDWSLNGTTSREELEQATIAKMKNVTGANENVCIAFLEEHRYDVKESIEAYLER